MLVLNEKTRKGFSSLLRSILRCLLLWLTLIGRPKLFIEWKDLSQSSWLKTRQNLSLVFLGTPDLMDWWAFVAKKTIMCASLLSGCT